MASLVTRSIFLVLLLLLAVPAYAEDAAPAPAAEVKAEEAAPEVTQGMKEHQKSAQKVFDLTKAVVEGITPEEQKHFFLMYSNYNLLGTVKMVQGDVGNAVEACGKENPEMKQALDARHKEWATAIAPVMKEADANVNNMVEAQEYAKVGKIREIFAGLDKTRDLASKQVEKTPVTTKEACAYLQDKMSDTQENFIRLLRTTLVSAPQVIQPDPPKKEEAAPAPVAEPAVEPAPISDPAPAPDAKKE